MSRCSWRASSAAGLLALALALATPIQAQETGESSGGEPADAERDAPELATIAVQDEARAETPPAAREASVLEDVVVTATKRSASVGEIPASIDAFRGSDLEEKNLTTLEQIIKYSPGVTVLRGNNPDETQVNIRGAGSPAGDFNRPFGMFFEDVPLLNPTIIGAQPEIDPFDLATVEVLKGPQGTLFGGSALVGAVRFVPNVPTHDRTYGSLSYGYGTTEHSNGANAQYTGMVNVPIGEALAVRLAGSVRGRAGIIDDTWSGQEDVDSSRTEHGRAIVSWKPWYEFDASLTHQAREAVADAGWATSIDNGEGRQVNGHRRGQPDGSVSDLGITSVKLNYSGFSPFALSLISTLTDKTATIWRDTSGAQQEPQRSTTRQWIEKIYATEQTTHELRIVSAQPSVSDWAWLAGWDYSAGLFYMRSDQKMHLNVMLAEADAGDVPLPDGFGQAILMVDGLADAVEHAFFFDVRHLFFEERLELNLGGRVFEQKTPVSLAVRATTPSPLPVPVPAVPVGEGANDTLVEKGFNPKAALTWHFSDDFSTFLGASKGFRFGGVNADPFQTGEPPTFYQSDSLWNYELGARTWWLDNRLRFDATLFWIEWDNKQENQLTSSSPPSEYIMNIGAARVRGVEAGLRTALPWGLSWLINGAYVDSRNKKAYDSPDGHVPAGTREGSTPRWTGASVLALDQHWGRFGIGASLDYTYRSALVSDELPLDAVGTFDISFMVRNTGWTMSPELSFVVNNLTNDGSLQAGGTNGRPEGDPERLVIARTVVPRTMTLNLKLSF